MPQLRIYIDEENHDWFKAFIYSLRDDKRIQELNLKVDHNMAFSILRAKANINDDESLEVAIQNFLESKR